MSDDPFADDLARKAAVSDDPFAADLRRKEKLAATQAKLASINAEPDPMSVGEIAKESGKEIWRRLKTMGSGIASLGSAVIHPIDTVTTPEKRRELLRGVGDTVTLGYGQGLADKLTSALPESMQHGTTGQEPASLQETEQSDAQTAPGYRAGGQLAGMFMPGATSAIGKAAGRVAGAATANPLLRAAVGYEVAAPVAAGLGAGASGNRLQAATDAALDPSGLALALGTSAAGGAVADKIKNSKGGQARQLIEREGQGARVGLTTPGSGGTFDNELAGVSADSKGVGIAARKGAENVMSGLREEHQAETLRPYKVMKAMIDNSPEASAPRDVTPIVTNMQNAVYDLGTAPQVRAQLEGQLKLLDRFRAGPDAPVMLPENQLNALRRTLMRAAKVGMTDAPGEKEAPLRAAAFEAKRMVDEGPYGALNSFYNEGAEKLTTARKQLGLKARPPADSNIDTKKVKLGLERETQNTHTAGGDTNLEAFRAEHPDLAQQTKLAQLQNAKAELAFRLQPEHGNLMTRIAGNALGPAAAIGTMALTHGSPAGIAGGLGIMALQNAAPVAGRVLYPLANRGPINPLVWAAQEDERKKAAAAARLRAMLGMGGADGAEGSGGGR